MKTFLIISSLLVAGGVIWFSVSNNTSSTKSQPVNNSTTVSFENDIQIIEVVSKSGGYYPSNIVAEADKETKLIVNSQNSYGCERAFRIPKLNVNQILPADGETTFDLGQPQKGDEIFASCSMGMYTFKIIFE